MINRNLYKRLERLEARVLVATVPRLVLVNDGTPGGLTCVWGPEGELVWWNPPAGCKVGELLDSSEDPESEMRIVFIGARDGKEAGPTTARGTDGRLVWLEPPEGCKAGEPIEERAGKFGSAA